MGQYLHLSCEDYALLTDVQSVQQVIAGQWQGEQANIAWQGVDMASINLLHRLTGNGQAISQHGIIMQSAENKPFVVLVGRVNDVQLIDEADFVDLPSLDFPFNEYFDKVYLQPTDKRCIYTFKKFV